MRIVAGGARQLSAAAQKHCDFINPYAELFTVMRSPETGFVEEASTVHPILSVSS
jgi:hypothetical protein